jgi:DNA helicase-2/ATP-dependent DNA helicase PcrA
VCYDSAVADVRELNPAQQRAVESTEGPVLILAGAGAGKTKTVTHRIAHIIERGTAPEHILAVTFTNKAAREMRERVVALLQEEGARVPSFERAPTVSTFHALCVQILRECAHQLQLPRFFSILDRSDSLKLVRQAEKDVGVDPQQFEPKRILGAISRAKGAGQTRDEYAAQQDNEYVPQLVAEVWQAYERLVRNEQALDFDDLLLETAVLLRTNPDVRAYYQQRWHYISVDEYQDTNAVQYELATTLAARHRNLCVVGDIDQTIYTWRGANLENLLRFEEDFPDTSVIALEENYRSTQTIIAASNDVIVKNRKRREKTLFTNNAAGEPLTWYQAYDEDDEARYVAEQIKWLTAEQGVPPDEIAILYRANYLSRTFEHALAQAGISYQLVGLKFFERKEVKDVLAYLRAALIDSVGADFKRAVNTPSRGIGQASVEKIAAGREHELNRTARAKLATFRELLARIRSAAQTQQPSAVIRLILEESGLSDALDTASRDDEERLENMRELVSFASRFDAFDPETGIEQLIENASLGSDQDELGNEASGIKLMTVHAAKGLEFNTVFLVGLESGLFPMQRGDDKHRDEEEERRLFYVALTRARARAYLTAASLRTVFGSTQVNTPSEFVNDIDPARLSEVDSDRASGGPTELLTID